jgi:hypothetical protein
MQRIEATASISGRNVNDEKAASYNKNKINKIRMINIQDGAINHIQKAVSAASHLPGSLHDEKKEKCGDSSFHCRAIAYKKITFLSSSFSLSFTTHRNI